MIDKIYDTAIIGGGLAGLSAAIVLAKHGHQVILFEKEKYPFHKVCGEYVSMESYNHLLHCGIPLNDFDLPKIKHLIVTSPSGKKLSAKLDPGGFGISRFLLDSTLKESAINNGVQIMESAKVDNVSFSDDVFEIISSSQTFLARTCIGAFGKKSNLDAKWKRFTPGNSKINNWIGVKYHVHSDQPADTIALHNFKDGYCGISKIEGDKYTLCYLTTAQNLNRCGNSIQRMESEILCRNPELKKLFAGKTDIYEKPLVISQVSFEKKTVVDNHVLMCGDSCGMISPLCGNGMSMAMHAGKVAAVKVSDYLDGRLSRAQLENDYNKRWNTLFSSRLKTGRIIQRLFGTPVVTDLFVSALKIFPFATQQIIRSTHGQPF